MSFALLCELTIFFYCVVIGSTFLTYPGAPLVPMEPSSSCSFLVARIPILNFSVWVSSIESAVHLHLKPVNVVVFFQERTLLNTQYTENITVLQWIRAFWLIQKGMYKVLITQMPFIKYKKVFCYGLQMTLVVTSPLWLMLFINFVFQTE